MRAALEAAANAAAEILRKDIIYAVHVLRYAGGKGHKQAYGPYHAPIGKPHGNIGLPPKPDKGPIRLEHPDPEIEYTEVDHPDTLHHMKIVKEHGQPNATGPDGVADGVQEPGEIADAEGNGYLEGTFVHKGECYGPDCTQTHGAVWQPHHAISIDGDIFDHTTPGAVWVDGQCYGRDCPPQGPRNPHGRHYSYAQEKSVEHHDDHDSHHGYKPHHDDKHHEDLKQSIKDAETAFNDMIAASRAEYRQLADTEIGESDAAR